jgi:hypothetical protein
MAAIKSILRVTFPTSLRFSNPRAQVGREQGRGEDEQRSR